jgi:hypothetical protein
VTKQESMSDKELVLDAMSVDQGGNVSSSLETMSIFEVFGRVGVSVRGLV